MRWIAMFIVAFTMMMGYFITDVVSPLESMLENPVDQGGMGWTSSEYGFFAGSYGIINVYLLMLFFGGLILDKLGIRFTGVLSCGLMVVGAFIKFWAIKYVSPLPTVAVPGIASFFGLTGQVKLQVLYAGLGFSIFGVGCEICGITVSKVLAKWFTGHGLALAMGIQVGMARLGTAAALGVSPWIAKHYQLSTPILFGVVCLCIGMLAYLVYCVMDKKLDDSIKANDAAKAEVTGKSADDEGFHLSDLKAIFTNPGFWLITILCLLFYSGVFPFLKFAAKLMIAKYHVDPELSGLIPSILPYGTIILTPIFGTTYDRVGKGATLMVIGSVMLTLVHLFFALPILNSVGFAIALTVLLGIAFSLVPSAMWPSVPKIIPMRQLGSAYAIIFWIQNIGLTMVPILIGRVLQASTVNGQSDFSAAMWVFTGFGIAAVVVAIMLLLLDKNKHYGLEEKDVK